MSDEDASRLVVKVVSLNVNCDFSTFRRSALRFEHRLPHIVSFVQSQSPGIVILNEVRDYAHEGVQYVKQVVDAFSVDFEVCVFRHNNTPLSFCNLILVSRRLGMVVEQRHLWPRPDGKHLVSTFSVVDGAIDRDGRSVGLCVIELYRDIAAAVHGSQPSGRHMVVAAFHASIVATDKRKQYGALAHLPQMYDGVPMILAGDFNLFAEDLAADMFAELHDVMYEVPFDDMPGTFLPYSHEARYNEVMRLPPQRLDRMFVAGGVRLADGLHSSATYPVFIGDGVCPDALAKKVPIDADEWKKQFPVDGLASDHFALVAQLDIGSAL